MQFPQRSFLCHFSTPKRAEAKVAYAAQESIPSRAFGLPAIVRKRLVGLGGLVHILAALDGVTGVVRGVENLTSQTIRHAALTALAREYKAAAGGDEQ